jgi:catalase
VPTGVGPALAAQTLAQRFVHEAWRHGKPIAVAPDAGALLEAAGVPASDDGVTVAEPAVLSGRLMASLEQHRFPRRVSVLRPS